jgi:hypothetical protein
MDLVSALQQSNTTTENGMVTNSSSLDNCVDMFFKIGAFRSAEEADVIRVFSLAFSEDPVSALRILFWARDIRGGAGERRVFRICLEYLSKANREAIVRNMPLISEYGRWDDLLVFFGTDLQDEAAKLIKGALDSENGLCAKWMPRKGFVANELRKFMGMTPKDYRKTLVSLTNVVEQNMCSGKWEDINYSQVPSVAAARYQRAFYKRDTERYAEYIRLLSLPAESRPEGVKINAQAVYPYDVLKSIRKGNEDVATAQWNELPDYMEGSSDMILPVVDVSGSMTTGISSGSSLTCMDVAISLGLYISERNVGPFQDHFITFSERPELQKLKGNLYERYHQLESSEWGMSTNLESVFDLVLRQAIKHNVGKESMPTKILILSDMEFNQAIRGGESVSAIEMIRGKYEQAGYDMPSIIFWNIQSRSGGNNVPVRFDESGTALISGFSPSILKSILSGNNITPIDIMQETINSERYKNIS